MKTLDPLFQPVTFLILCFFLANSNLISVSLSAQQTTIEKSNFSGEFQLLDQIQSGDSDSRGIYSVVFSPSGKYLAWRDRANRLTVYDTFQKKKLFSISPHDANWIQSIVFSPDSKLFVTVAGSGESVKVWETETGKLIRRIKRDAEIAWFSLDGTELALLGTEDVEVFSMEKPNRSNKAKWRLKSELPLTLSQDGKLVISYRKVNQEIHQLELFNLTSKIRIDLPGDPSIPKLTQFSPDSRCLAGAFEDLQRVHLWCIEDPKNQHYLLDGHRDPVTSLGFSGDSRFLVTGSDSQIILWDLLTRQSIKIIDVAVLAKGLRFHSESKTERVNIDSRTAIKPASATNPMKVRSLAFSTNGFHLAVGAVQGEESVLSIVDLTPLICLENGPAGSAERVWIELGSSSAEVGLIAAGVVKQKFASLEKELSLKINQQVFSNGSTDVDGLIEQLSSDNFREREFATDQLARRSNQLTSRLKSKLVTGLNSEARYRIRKILSKQTTKNITPIQEVRRWNRLVFGLEMEGSRSSRTLLRKIQNGHSDSNISQLATEALARMPEENRN